MKIKSYKFKETIASSFFVDKSIKDIKPIPLNWNVSKFNLNDINLIAGLSGVGKTRLINTIYNLGQMIKKQQELSHGEWDINFEIDNTKYRYELIIKPSKNINYISKEKLYINNTLTINRNKNGFYYGGEKLPKLGENDLGIYLLRNENKIKNVYEGFSRIFIRRNNPDFESGPKIYRGLGVIDENILSIDSMKVEELETIFTAQINIQLFLLQKFFPEKYKMIINNFKEIFPFVTDLEIATFTRPTKKKIDHLPPNAILPMMLMKEKDIESKIPLTKFSSGMLRSLIQLIDISIIPKGSIYIIDEVENSMGIKSLPVLIDLILDHSNDIQFIFTTHHPYIFNNVNIKYWKILTRKGTDVTIYDGIKLKKEFSKSYQEDYIQLINTELIEKGI